MTRQKAPNIKLLRYSHRGYHTIRVGTRKRSCRCTGGLRPKYFGTDFVVKFDDVEWSSEYKQTSLEIQRMGTIDPYDRRYFPKMLGYNNTEGYLVQERVEFKKPKDVTWAERLRAEKIVNRLNKKYGFTDVGVAQMACGVDWNWAIRKDGRPVIYDFAL